MFKLVLLVFNILVIQTYCRSVPNSKTNLNPLSSANNHFGLQLLNQLSDNKSNVFISPFSISNAFAMLYSGAKGQTAQEMRQVLGYELANLTDHQLREEFKNVLNRIANDPKNYELKVANKLLIQNDFNILETYAESLQKYFKSSAQSVDFAAAPLEVMNSVNQYVNQQTKGKIR